VYEDVDWIYLAQDMVQWQDPVDTIINIQATLKVVNFKSS
jgi:hypothetical protein